MVVNPPGDSYNYSSFGNVWRLAAEFTPPGDRCKNRGFRGEWRLTACVFRLAIWNAISPGGSRATPSDNAGSTYLFAWDVRGLQGFGDTLKVDCWSVP